MDKFAFTLLEVLVVIIIIGILATIGLVNYTGVKEHALGKEAQVNLKLIAAAEKIYRMENAGYYPIDAAQVPLNDTITDINDNLKLYFTDETNWDYDITVATTNTFTATAQRQGSGPYSTCIYTVNQGTGEPTGTGCP